jgi:hypothetical protein
MTALDPADPAVLAAARRERRAFELHRLVAAKIRQEPALFDRAREILKRWQATVSPGSKRYLDEWERLMDQGIEVTLRVALQDTERKSSPFSTLLSSQEREAWRRETAE